MRLATTIALILIPALGSAQATPGGIVPENIEAINAEILLNQPKTKTTLAGLPESWDCRELGYRSAVLDQRNCGSCWSVATIAVANAVASHDLGTTVVLSSQWLLEKSRTGAGCAGGWIDFVPFTVESAGDTCGIVGGVLEQDFPYAGSITGRPCETLTDRYITFASKRLYGWRGANSKPVIEEIKRGLVEVGPLASGIHWGGSIWHCNDWSIQVAAVDYPANGRNINHCVMIVGYGKEKGVEYFIIQNSYGKNWGVGGFARVEVGSYLVGYSAVGVVGTGLLQPLPPLPDPTPTPRPIGAPQPETAYSPVGIAETSYVAPQAAPEPITIRADWTQLGAVLALAVILAIMVVASRRRE